MEYKLIFVIIVGDQDEKKKNLKILEQKTTTREVFGVRRQNLVSVQFKTTKDGSARRQLAGTHLEIWANEPTHAAQRGCEWPSLADHYLARGGAWQLLLAASFDGWSLLQRHTFL